MAPKRKARGKPRRPKALDDSVQVSMLLEEGTAIPGLEPVDFCAASDQFEGLPDDWFVGLHEYLLQDSLRTLKDERACRETKLEILAWFMEAPVDAGAARPLSFQACIEVTFGLLEDNFEWARAVVEEELVEFLRRNDPPLLDAARQLTPELVDHYLLVLERRDREPEHPDPQLQRLLGLLHS